MSALLTWWLPAAALGAGIVLFWVGRHGRRTDDHPVCRKCGRDLYGLPALPDRCPECGRELTSRCVRIGNRQRSPYLAAAGAFLVVPALFWSGGLATLFLAGSDFDKYKPVWLLALEMEGTSAPSASAELMRRLGAGELEAETERSLIERFLKHQASPRRPWVAYKGDFIELAQRRGALDWPRWERYVRNGTEPALSTRTVVTAGGTLPVHIDTSKLRFGTAQGPFFGGMGYFGGITVRLALYPAAPGSPETVADGSPTELAEATVVTLQSLSTGIERHYLKVPGMAAAGDSEVAIVLTLCAVPESARDIAIAQAFASDPIFSEALRLNPFAVAPPQWSPEVGRPVRVVPDRFRSVKVTEAPAVIAAALQTIETASLQVGYPEWWKVVLIQQRESSYEEPQANATILLRLRPPQLAPGACYRVFVDDGRREHACGVARWRAGDQHASVAGRLPPDFDAATTDRVRLILRPDPKAAERTVDLYEIRGGEIVLEDVPVTYPEWFHEHRPRLAAAAGAP